MTRSYIWPLGNRISHVLMIVLFAAAYLSGDSDELLRYHVIFGIVFAILILFRIGWGLFGPNYSKFRDFDLSLTNLKSYLVSVFTKHEKYVGHNPASSFAIITMIIVSILAIFSGLLDYGVSENHGVFAFLHQGNYEDMEIFEELHEVLVNIFLGIVLVHIAGSLMDKFVQKGDAVDSMISGFKSTPTYIGISTNVAQKAYQVLWIVIALASLVYLFGFKDNLLTVNYNKPTDYAKVNPAFYNECGSCHIAYPPYLLPKASWVKMMDNLENHFGDDASLDEQTKAVILDFLVKNSSDSSTHQDAIKIRKSLEGEKQTIIAISQTPFWKAKHKDIDSRVFKSNKVKSKANCQACHIDIEKGMLENDLIKMPKGV
ncbi:MAG: cytochrome b/b6 domain-containing protein [Sulfurovaceae bacterium]|nr:cytochrome b/b6 domain-containing protein [Sulfurovaceae bacterium]